MTNERAAEILNPTHYEDYDSLETVQEACRMGMVALKMQIPEVPLAPGAIFDFTCPYCGSRDYLKNEDGNRNKFCGQCGKALFECSKFPPCTERMIVEGRLAEALYFSERMMEKTYKDLETEGKTNVG